VPAPCSILFARFKGNLTGMVTGALAVEGLRPGDRVLIAAAWSEFPDRPLPGWPTTSRSLASSAST